MKIEITPAPSTDDVATVYQGLVEFNEVYFPGLNEQQLACFVRSSSDEILGGIVGVILFTSLYIKYLWISETVRGQGYGKMLLAAIENEALNAGVINSIVDTYSFQAPDFYEKFGYSEAGRYKNYPRVGIDKIFYSKVLSAF